MGTEDITLFKAEQNSVAVLSTLLGGFILLFGFVSFVVKERLFLSESLVATAVGIAFGPLAGGALSPFIFPNIQQVTFDFSQVVICIQIMAAAIALPRKFWAVRWKSVALLLGPAMLYMWLVSALIVHYILQRPWIEALIIAACMAPTDPILANSIVSGRFADMHIPVAIRQLLSAESAANDGVAFPMFTIALFLYKLPMAKAFETWVWATWAYAMGLAIVFGILVGLASRVALRYSETHNWIDKKNFLSFEIALALFVMGLCTIFYISSFIAVFFAGIAFAWDGWFAAETEEAHVQEVIDMLLNLSFFIYFGTVIPWSALNTETLPLWRLILAAILALLFRRLPFILLLYKYIPPLFTLHQASLFGWFGPIGVAALNYMAIASLQIPENETIVPIVTFMVLVSVISFGITLPFAHVTIVTISSMSRSREVNVPTWPTNLPTDASMISRPVVSLPTPSLSQPAPDFRSIDIVPPVLSNEALLDKDQNQPKGILLMTQDTTATIQNSSSCNTPSPLARDPSDAFDRNNNVFENGGNVNNGTHHSSRSSSVVFKIEGEENPSAFLN